MTVCSHCGRTPPDGADFCACGAFLGWDSPEAAAPAGGAADAALAQPAGGMTAVLRGPTEPVSLKLFVAEQEGAAGRVALSVPAGGRVTFVARVGNQSTIVDSYELSVEGLPGGWWTIDPPTAYLLPVGSREGYEEDIVIAVHPPRSPSATAEQYAFTVVATSQSHRTREARAQASVTVEPFWSVAAAARPAAVAGRQRAQLEAGVENTGNTPVAVTVTGVDPEDRCRLKVAPLAPVRIVNGTLAAFRIGVYPRRPHFVGRPIDHRLELSAHTVEEPQLAVPFLATFRQRPWIAWWVLPLILLLAIVGVLLYLLWPRHATVPDVRREPSAFAAQKRLERAGLTLNPAIRTVLRPHAKAGSVVDQAPAPGKDVPKGKSVSVVVAAGNGRVRVPRLAGLKVVDADQKLQSSHLTLGAVLPKLNPAGRVGSQVPEAGDVRLKGTAVNVVLAKPKPKAKKKAGPAKKTGAGGAMGVPAVAGGGGGAAAAGAKLKAAGLTPGVPILQISTAKAGTVLGTVPPKGSPPPPDRVVRLILSAGFPRLAYDSGTFAFTTGGATGRPTKSLARGAEVSSGGAWAPDASEIAFTKAGRLLLATPGVPGRPRQIDIGRRKAAAATFAPTLDTTALVFAATGGSGRESVCWLGLTGGSASGPSCRPALPAGWTIGGFAWSPRGTVLLVEAHTPSGPGLLKLATGVGSAFSTAQADWRGGAQVVTPDRGGRGVIAAAYSPDGKQLAVVSNLVSDDYRVALAAANDVTLKKPNTLPLVGCDVAWRPDGAELAVVQEGASCVEQVGPIVRVALSDPGLLRTTVLSGRHPSWEPIDLSPGPGRSPAPGTQP
jgi:beta-lactam-binding protein with PASTA domain